MWLLENKSNLPKTFKCEKLNIIDVAKFVDVSLFSIDQDIKNNGKPSRISRPYKDRLVIFYDSLKNNHTKIVCID